MFESIIVTSETVSKTDWALMVDGEVMYNGRFSKRNMKATANVNLDHGSEWKPL